LTKSGADINAITKRGIGRGTALTRAILFENDYTLRHGATVADILFVAQELLKNGADINIADANGKTALLHAVDALSISSNHYHDYLGRDYWREDESEDEDDNDCYFDCEDEDDEVRKDAGMAVYNGNAIDIIRGLLELGADINFRNAKGQTALMAVAMMNKNSIQQEQQEEIIRLLLAHGANAAMIDDEGKTSLTHAKENSSLYKKPAYWMLNDAFYAQQSIK
jgi:ankyrin repeat protein